MTRSPMTEELSYEILRALDDTPSQSSEELVRMLEGAGLKVSLEEVNDWLNLHERSLVLWEARGKPRWKLTSGGHDRLAALAPR
jgi:hypothetical protein